MDLNRLEEQERYLRELLGRELSEVIGAISNKPSKDNPYLIELPDANMVDLPMEDVMAYVAKSANNFGRVARLAGMARAEAKLAKGRYERKFKRLRSQGKNDAERESLAMEGCIEEHMAMVNADAVAELAESLEAAARIASESSRKILDKTQAMQMAATREQAGYISDRDFRPY